jgi:hypothetical protein
LALGAALAACGGEPPTSDVGVATEKLSTYYTSTAFPNGTPPAIYPSFMISKPIGADVGDFSGTHIAINPGELITFTAGNSPGGNGDGRDVFRMNLSGSVQAGSVTLNCTGIHLGGNFDPTNSVHNEQGGFFPQTEFPLAYSGATPGHWGAWFGWNDGNSDMSGGTCVFQDPVAAAQFPARAPVRVRLLPYVHSSSQGDIKYVSGHPALNDWNRGYLMIIMRYSESGTENRYYINVVGNTP